MNVQRVLELLAFDEETGIFTWKRNLAGRFRAGKVAGCVANHGYVAIGLDGKDYLAHRLVWLISHGQWPDEFVDHKNGNRTDNRLENLREATPRQNLFNSKVRSDSGSGLKGAHLHKLSGRWNGYIRNKGRKVSLGYFDTAEEAHAAYAKAAVQMRGEFARSS